MKAELLRAAAAVPVLMRSYFTETECGTVGCLAGNMAIQAGLKRDTDPLYNDHIRVRGERMWPDEWAVEYAELPNDSIFFAPQWPYPLYDGNNPTQAQVIAAVEDYIATDGWTKEPTVT